ncbi:MAG: DUF255 domain-containing protein, partial [Acidobacteriota bacterium]
MLYFLGRNQAIVVSNQRHLVSWVAAAALLLCTTGAGPQRPEEGSSDEIHWMEWSKEAFQRAKSERKPILLQISVGWTRASRWIDQNVFSDPEVVKLANDRWVPIRIERDQRPDIDLRYQIAANVVSEGRGGWPLTALLTQTGEILYGRSYIQLDDRRGNPGLRSILAVGADRYAQSPDAGAEARTLVTHAFERESRRIRPPIVSVDLLHEIAAGMLAALHPEYGGFGSPPGLPNPFALDLAATLYHRFGDRRLLDAMLTTLHGMERGAIFDQVGGGF